MKVNIRDDVGTIIATIEGELVEVGGHWLAVHRHYEDPKKWRVTEPRTGYFVSEGTSADDAIKKARQRVAEFIESEEHGKDPIAQTIFTNAFNRIKIGLGKLGNGLTASKTTAPKEGDEDE
jgi:hypothetical protein